MTDNRVVSVVFIHLEDKTEVIINFDVENENPIKLQQQGWQLILDNFKKYTENN